eukprot:624784-Amphidinium_carterae.1
MKQLHKTDDKVCERLSDFQNALVQCGVREIPDGESESVNKGALSHHHTAQTSLGMRCSKLGQLPPQETDQNGFQRCARVLGQPKEFRCPIPRRSRNAEELGD